MRKYISVVFALMLGGLYALPLQADSNGDQPEYPASSKQVPGPDSVSPNATGAPKLVVEFQSAYAEIPSTYSTSLDVFGQYLKNNPGTLAKIDGYADHTGHGPANAALAQKRADAVKAYLITHYAVDSSRITAKGFGEVSTKNRNDTESGQQANRSAVGTIIEPKS